MSIKCYMCRKNVNVNGRKYIKKEKCCICFEESYETMIVLDCDHYACRKCTETLINNSYNKQINNLNNLFVNDENTDKYNMKNINQEKIYKEYSKILNEALLTNLYMLNIQFS